MTQINTNTNIIGNLIVSGNEIVTGSIICSGLNVYGNANIAGSLYAGSIISSFISGTYNYAGYLNGSIATAFQPSGLYQASGNYLVSGTSLVADTYNGSGAFVPYVGAISGLNLGAKHFITAGSISSYISSSSPTIDTGIKSIVASTDFSSFISGILGDYSYSDNEGNSQFVKIGYYNYDAGSSLETKYALWVGGGGADATWGDVKFDKGVNIVGYLGVSGVVVFQNTLRLPYYGNGFVKTTGSNGTLAIDTTSYISGESDTLQSVTGRGASTTVTTNFKSGESVQLGTPGTCGYLKFFTQEEASVYTAIKSSSSQVGEGIVYTLPENGSSGLLRNSGGQWNWDTTTYLQSGTTLSAYTFSGTNFVGATGSYSSNFYIGGSAYIGSIISSGIDIKGSLNVISNLSVSGNTYIRMPYLMLSSTETQVGSPINTKLTMTFNNVEDMYQMTLSGGSIINFQQAGDYLINVSAIGQNTSPTTGRIQVWPCKNGSNVIRSNTIYDFKGQNTYAVIAVPFILDVNVSDTLCMNYAANNDGVQLPYTGSTAYSPETPSVIITINKISEITA